MEKLNDDLQKFYPEVKNIVAEILCAQHVPENTKTALLYLSRSDFTWVTLGLCFETPQQYKF